MINCAEQNNFMSPHLIDRLRFTVEKKDQAYDLVAIDKSPLLKKNRRVNRQTPLLLMLIERHYEKISFDIATMARHDVILGIL